MQFNSYEFIFCFFPITVFLYYATNKVSTSLGKIILILSSVVFYSWGRANLLIYLGISILCNYSLGLLTQRTEKRKLIVVISLIINIGLLFYFKYLFFGVSNINRFFGTTIELREIILPLGISFYSFQQIAYVVEKANGNLENNSLIDYLAYILYFPKLVMGPIVDPVDYISQINNDEAKRINLYNVACGIRIFSYGLIKKVLIADTFASAVNWVHTNLSVATSMDVFLSLIFYSFEIYFDFSGYSDMAVGISMVLNIELPINFDSPYKALSIRDFWKRWHISLTRFLTKYIYIPLGGSRKGKTRTYLNMMIVFIISGIWHGANWTFVLWGIFHGFFSCLDRAFSKIEEKVFMPIRWLWTFGLVSVLWALFSADSITQWKMMLLKIVFMQDTAISEGLINVFYMVENNLFRYFSWFGYISGNIRGFNLLFFIIAACTIIFIPENNYRNKTKLGIGSLVLSSGAFIWGVLCLGAESSFVYYGF